MDIFSGSEFCNYTGINMRLSFLYAPLDVLSMHQVRQDKTAEKFKIRESSRK